MKYLKSFSQKVNENKNYEGTSWTAEIDGKEVTVTIQEVQKYLDEVNAPTIELLVDDIYDMCVQFTTDLSEKRGVEKMIEISSDSKIPGFAKYYWIKEVNLPEGSWKKTTLGTPIDLESKISNQRKLSKSGERSSLCFIGYI